MLNKRYRLVSCVTAVGVATLMFAAYSLRSRVAAAQTEVPPPYSVSIRFTTVDRHGQEVSQLEKLLGSDGRGSTIEVKQSFNGENIDDRIVYNLISRERIVVNSVTESLTTYKLSESAIQRLTKSAKCTQEGGSEKILGVPVTKSSERRALGPNRSIETESWLAPVLGCLPLRVVKTSYENGQPSTKNITEATAVSLNSPVIAMFTLPSNYVERPPSQVMMELARRRPDLCGACTESPRKLTEMDASYFNSRKPQN